MEKNNIKPVVSVVITTKNEEKNIEQCLLSITKQTYPQNHIEMIVVDNNSTDNTKKIALKYTSKVFNHGPERSAQRNFGAAKSHGFYYLYLDADMTLSEKLIEQCVEMFEKEPRLVGLYIPEIVTGSTFWAKVRRFEREFYNATPIDCVRFVRLSDFKKVGGFDETMSGPEDWDFDKKIRKIGKVSIISAPLYHNEGDINIDNYLAKKGYYAKSFATYIKKWGRSDPDIKKQLGFYYRFFGLFVEHGKWRKIIRHPILFVAIILLRIRVGMAYLKVKQLAKKYD